MCTVSMIFDEWNRRPNMPWGSPYDQHPFTPAPPTSLPNNFEEVLNKLQGEQLVTRKEFNALKQELESLKKLLIAAKQYDKESGQPDCEQADKAALLRQIAKLIGVDFEEVFNP